MRGVLGSIGVRLGYTKGDLFHFKHSKEKSPHQNLLLQTISGTRFTFHPPYPSPFSPLYTLTPPFSLPTLLPLPFSRSPRHPTTPFTIAYQQHSSVACRSPALTTYDTSSITVSNACTGPLPTPQTTPPPIPHTKSSQVEEKLKLLA